MSSRIRDLQRQENALRDERKRAESLVKQGKASNQDVDRVRREIDRVRREIEAEMRKNK